MIMPLMNGNKTNRVSVPYLSGGINPGSVGEAVADNQLTDCLNVWFQGGEVITRPKLDLVLAPEYKFDFDNSCEVETFINGKKAKMIAQTAFAQGDYSTVGGNTAVTIKTLLISADCSITKTNINTITLGASYRNYHIIDICHYAGTPKKENSIGVYTIIKYMSQVAGEAKRYKYIEWLYSGSALYFEEFEPYAPQVLINGVGNLNPLLPRTAEAEQPVATLLEGFNLLGSKYKATFTSDSISNAFYVPMSHYRIRGTVSVNVDISNMSVKGRVYWSEGQCGVLYNGGGFFEYNSTTQTYDKIDDKLTFTFNTTCHSNEHNLGETIEVVDDEILSDEIYFIDGFAPLYNSDGKKKVNRYYYRCMFRGKLNIFTGKITFPMLENSARYLYKYDSGNTTDHFYGDTIENSTAVYGVNGKDEKGKDYGLNIQNAKLCCIDTEKEGEEKFDILYERIVKYKINNVDYEMPRFYVHNNEDYSFVFPSNGSIRNNIEVVVDMQDIEINTSKITACSLSCLYGGSVGSNYGTRSFVAGADNKIYFSDIDNPYYFDENCYVGVGHKGEKITALAKQSGYLVIFKENSIYLSYKVEVSQEELAQKAQAQSIVDIVAQYKYKIITVNSEVGCDLPKTIVLCMNKLIFGNKNGNVYVLNSLSNYSERNIFTVSGLIKDKLQNFDTGNWQNAFALDYKGYYILFIDDKAFCLNYNRNAFKYVGSYTTDSNVTKYGMFSWWIWKFPQFLRCGISDDGNIQLVLYNQEATILQANLTFNTLLSSPETACESYIVSKFFDFSYPDLYKGIEKLILNIGNDYDSEISVDLLTDGGSVYKLPNRIIKNGDRGTASYQITKTIRPKIRLCKKFGFKIGAKGPLALGSVVINYNLKGSVKNGN